jgi:hypothetical protein
MKEDTKHGRDYGLLPGLLSPSPAIVDCPLLAEHFTLLLSLKPDV